MDLSLQKVLDVDFSGPQWLGSAKGLQTTDPVTLDVSTWSSAFYPQGRLPSGLYLGKITSGGKYGKYDDAASDGRQTCVGFLATPVNIAYTGGTPLRHRLHVHAGGGCAAMGGRGHPLRRHHHQQRGRARRERAGRPRRQVPVHLSSRLA
jgi:hypothetical protein